MIRRCGSIREAARRLHVASSAVNRQLLQLEDEIGSPLFDRIAGGLKLTPAGELFSRHVITVLQDEHRLESELDLLKGIHRGALNVIAVEGVNADLLPTTLELMLKRYPAIRIQQRSSGSANTVDAVVDGDADVAIAFSLQRHEALRQCAVGQFALGAIIPPGHPLAALSSVSFAECARHPLILATSELSIQPTMRPLIANYKRELSVVLETASIELAKTMAARGIGVAFQTRIGLERDIREGRLVHVPLKAQTRLTNELGVYVRSGRTLPPAVDAFIRIVAEEIERRASEEST